MPQRLTFRSKQAAIFLGQDTSMLKHVPHDLRFKPVTTVGCVEPRGTVSKCVFCRPVRGRSQRSLSILLLVSTTEDSVTARGILHLLQSYPELCDVPC